MTNAAGNLHSHHHAVQFYGSEQSLYATVAGFLGEGLVADQTAIIIATPEHAAAVEEHLSGKLIDTRRARQNGNLIVLDAEEMLDLFLVGDVPVDSLFEANVGRMIQPALSGRPTIVRAYGEMADVLWKQGRAQSAIALEILWNKLAVKHNFALLCGYAMGSFYKQTKHLEEIAAQHSHVLADEPNVAPFMPGEVVRTA